MVEQEVQVNLPDEEQEKKVYLKALTRTELAPKEPIEELPYGKGNLFRREGMVSDGSNIPVNASEMKDRFTGARLHPEPVGIRRQILTKKYWNQVIEEMAKEKSLLNRIPVFCSEYESNFGRSDFKPRNLYESADKDVHLKYPLYGPGSSAITFYSENLKKTGKGDVLEKFRRSQDFTKPVGERLDDGWVL